MPHSTSPIGTDIQDDGYGLLRIPLPSTWVNSIWSMRRTPLGGIMHGADPLEKNAGLQGGGHSYVVGGREHGLGPPLLRGTRQGGLGHAGTHDGPRLRRSHPDSQPTA